MARPARRATLCLFLVVLAGCVGGIPGLDGGTSCQECLPPEHSDGGLPRCLIAERQPDIGYWNYDSNPHHVSVVIVRNNGSVVYSNATTVPPAAGDHAQIGTFEDVIASPGQYTITARVDNASAEARNRTFERRWHGSGDGMEWRIYIRKSGDFRFKRHAHA